MHSFFASKYRTYLKNDGVEHKRVQSGDIEVENGEATCFQETNNFRELSQLFSHQDPKIGMFID